MAFSKPDFSDVFFQKHNEEGLCLPCPRGHIDNNAKFHKNTYVAPNPSVLSKKADHNAIETMDDSVRIVFTFLKNTPSAKLTTTLLIKKSPLSITYGH